MPVTTKARACLVLSLLLCGLASSSLSGCAVFGSHGESTVARGKYYASGDPYYDEFFVALYLLQVDMAEAAKLPDAELQRLTELLQLESQATPAMIELNLHERALKLSHSGVHLRLDQTLAPGQPEAATTVIRSNARPQENPTAALLASIETSSSNLLRWSLTMKQKEEALGRLELMTIRLDAGVERAFSQAPVGKPSEVRQNLADAHKLIPLMRARAEHSRERAEQLLAALTHGIDTDDGSLPPPVVPSQPNGQGAHEPAPPPDAPKKAASKPRPKGKPAGTPPAAQPKPPASDSDEPPKPRAGKSKPAPPPRDFEP